MQRLDFWFDPVSPFAYLAFEHLPQALQGCSYAVAYRPVLFAGLLKHWGQKGPAEIAPKRDWTFRHVEWLARRHGIVLQPPASHPFNPLPLLRLALAAGPNRLVVEAVMRHVWQGGGADVADALRLQALTARLAPAQNPQSAGIKQALHDNTAEAVRLGIFGVPTLQIDGRLFWGFDALEMAAEALRQR